MRRGGRGFTFIEVAIVLPMGLLLTLVVFQLYMVFTTELQTAAMQGDLKQGLRRAAAQIYRRTGKGGWRLDADNRGLRLADGSAVRWDGERLTLAGQSLVQQPVRLFLATAQERQLVLTFEVEAPNHWRGEPHRQRMVFEGSPR